MIDLTLRCPECGARADMCFAHGDDWKKRTRLRQPAHEPWDWAGLMADQDADDRRAAPYLGADDDAERMPSDRRH